MSRSRPTLETLESLRATLAKLEQTEAVPDDSKSISELKRVLLNRIADLELAQILEKSPDVGATDKAVEPDDLVLPKSAVGEIPPDGSVKNDD